MAVTELAPARQAANARNPEPVPMFRTSAPHARPRRRTTSARTALSGWGRYTPGGLTNNTTTVLSISGRADAAPVAVSGDELFPTGSEDAERRTRSSDRPWPSRTWCAAEGLERRATRAWQAANLMSNAELGPPVG